MKNPPSPLTCPFAFWSKLICLRTRVRLFLGSPFSSADLLVRFSYQFHTLFITVVLEEVLKSRSAGPPTLFSFLNVFLHCSVAFALPRKFYNQHVNSYRKPARIFQVALNSPHPPPRAPTRSLAAGLGSHFWVGPGESGPGTGNGHFLSPPETCGWRLPRPQTAGADG